MIDEYQSVEGRSVGEFKDRGSKFFAYTESVNSIDDVKLFIQQIKEAHPKARHYCYAYRIGLDKLKNYRANDDGEPSGSAGKPILGQIDSAGLTNVMVIVVRYFGGTKLGVPGLINAYRTATRESLNVANVIHKEIKDYYELSFGYELMNEVMRVIKREQIYIEEQKYENDCKIIFSAKKSESARFINTFQQTQSLHTLQIKYLYTI